MEEKSQEYLELVAKQKKDLMKKADKVQGTARAKSLYAYLDETVYPENFQDKEFALHMINVDYQCFNKNVSNHFFSDAIRKDEEVLKLYVQVNKDLYTVPVGTFDHINKELAVDLMRIARHEDRLVKCFPPSILDSEFVMQNPSMYRLANNEVKGNYEVAKAAIEHNDNSYFYFPYELRVIKEFAQIYMENTHYDFNYIPENLKADFDIAKKAVQDRPDHYKSLDIEMRCNKEITLIAVEKIGHLLNHTSHKLKDDEDVVALAVLSGDSVIGCASHRIVSMVGNEDPIKFFTSKQLKEKLTVKLSARDELALAMGETGMRDRNEPKSSSRKI